jgi:hypothetical protein
VKLEEQIKKLEEVEEEVHSLNTDKKKLQLELDSVTREKVGQRSRVKRWVRGQGLGVTLTRRG